ncbi:TPA: hypothetical protein DF272_06460 [Candidatus Falkowbacteria bacterium]|nr:hypothetical protein [Candidatus Falkowbacteria bacterium]
MVTVYYKDLSYELNGLAFEMFKYHGYGQREKTYCDYYCSLLDEKNLKYKRERYIPALCHNEKILKRYADIIVEDLVVIEMKVGKRLRKVSFDQTLEYLKLLDKKLGLLIWISPNGAQVYRVLNG